MGTFLEFYTSLLKFVNFKLFSDARVSYPLKDNQPISKLSSYLDATKVKQMQTQVGKLFSQARAQENTEIEFQDTPEIQ
jgi:hypothetical protein